MFVFYMFLRCFHFCEQLEQLRACSKKSIVKEDAA